MSQSIPHTGSKLALSRFAHRLLAARPELGAELADPRPFTRAEMLNALAGRADDELARGLRRLRNHVLLRVMARDLSGRAGLDEVCGTMTDLAEVAIESALGDEDLIVVGMGKLGGRELNVSSDVDLVFLYRGSAEAQERYERAGRRLIRLLSEPTAEGFVFRVDMRLRPYGESGPLACNFEALEQYFITHGREWERYAWLKARPLTMRGRAAAMRELDAIVRPFVFRKYLDYGTLGALRTLHAEVRRDVARRELAEHVKLGPGGIREIEFIVQALQLVRGGRDPELRVRPTLPALKVLSEKNLLPLQPARELGDAYVFLRSLEHRLQYLDDAQRHDLPQDAEDRARVAAMCGFTSWDAFYAQWQAIRDSVSRHFLDVFAEPGTAPEAWPQHPRLAALRASQRYAALPEESRRRLDRLVPALARAAQATPDPEATLVRGVDLVEAIASRAAYLALLAEHPEALERVARMIASSSWAAEYVTRHPLLLDELLDDRLLYAPPDWISFASSLRRQLAAAHDDTERRMNILREMHQAQVFRLLAQDLAGLLTVEKLADHLSALADLMLQACIDEVWRDLRARHREAPRFAVIGYGKLGGKELGYASDLDIIFLYDDDDERAPELYARLAQRLNTWLSSRTSSGILFETDLELRPSGASGLLVSSIGAFGRYQDESAWVWEHQALTRARYCAGDADVGIKFEAVRQRILTRRRDPKQLRAEILAMRNKLHAAHPNTSNLFDVKHDAGGMIDIEFAVQFLVLGFSSEFASLTGNLGNIALLKMAADHGLISAELAERSRNAYRAFRRVQHSLRLNGARYARVPREQVAAESEAVRALWQAVFGRGANP
ncbi:MAG TPA: bifunctional [glutamate--ammonia ligase]-adenylyl-L-tyrosine phosphorylase/[glutamate--ammonia-ligase] adenylyltransferase [Burkholderiales bacterium]|nr:bifunctional [glutamate--ammonia ligase]-adenylyl-L-tyrosine phosphorylase/[glutamate--ammonia-ligase] adenylyltransferase [Burkholderiales bacterium]